MVKCVFYCNFDVISLVINKKKRGKNYSRSWIQSSIKKKEEKKIFMKSSAQDRLGWTNWNFCS